MERRLAAILAADMVAYSRLMAADEANTISRQKAHRLSLIDPKIAQYGGRIVKTTGDGMLVEFSSVVDAVRCSVEIQHAVLDREAQVPDSERICYRVGINLGDIVIDGDDILGDGVDIAARLEGLAEPGGICLSRPVHTQIKGKLDLTFEHLGEKEVKNIAEPVNVYRVVFDEKTAGLITPVVREEAKQTRWRLPIAAAAVVVLLAVGGVIWWQPWAPEFVPASVEKMAYPLPDKPSIAVLPFDNIGNDEEQEYLADGITNDLITDLSRFGDLFVVAANSSFTYKGKPVQVQQVAEELGVQYLLEGSIQRVGDTIRINAQLIDALSGHHLWAERYDRKADDFFAIQDEILKTIIGTLQPQVKEIEKERAFKRPTENLTAYDYFKRGVAYSEEWEKESNSKAQEMQEKPIELDPEYARAYANLGLIHANDWLHDWSEDRAQSHALALQYARKGVELDPDDYWNIWGLARIYD